MPFTFAHPAAVLPLTYLPKKWFSLTGLVIGSMAPDFEYFIRMRIFSSFSHTWSGLFWFCLPLSILLAFIFHAVVRDILIDNLPKALKDRVYVFKQFKWTDYLKSNLVVVIISSIIGIATHILWDGFTHQHGHFVQIFDVLQQTVSIGKFTIPLYKVLQHLSTILGGILIVYALSQLPVNNEPKNEHFQVMYWPSVVLISVTVVSIRLLAGINNNLLGNLIATAIAGGMIGLILTPMMLSIKFNGR